MSQKSKTVTQQASSRQYKFSCFCATYDITPRKLATALAGVRFCDRCKKPLEYAGEVRVGDGPWTLQGKAQLEQMLASKGSGRILERGRPPRAAPAARTANRPTQKQLELAEQLCKRLRQVLPSDARNDKMAMSSWLRGAIETAKKPS